MTEDQNQKNPSNEDEDSRDSRNFAIAMHYTEGNEEKAKLMVSDNYKDLYVFKIKFSSPHMNGALLIFFNYFYKTLTDCYYIISNSYDILKFNTEQEWQQFEEMISDFMDRGEHDQVLMYRMFEKVRESFNPQVGSEIVNMISKNSNDGLKQIFSSDILHRFGYENLKVDLSYETISSLNMELNSKSSRKLTENEIEGEQESEDSEEENLEVITEDDKEDYENFVDRDIKLILNGALILSPIKGMNITGLVVGDKIRIKLTESTPKAVQIARAFNAYRNGRMGPIQGEIVSFRKKSGGGFKIFLEITDGVFIRINEEEENIKVDFVESSKRRPEHLQKGIEKYVDKHVESEKKKSNEDEDKSKPKKLVKIEVNLMLLFILLILSVLTVFAIALFL